MEAVQSGREEGDSELSGGGADGEDGEDGDGVYYYSLVILYAVLPDCVPSSVFNTGCTQSLNICRVL